MILQALKRLMGDQHPLRLAWHKFNAYRAAKKYGFPSKKLTVIGITGTDGKTTTVGMTAHILQKNGIKVGALSTAFFQIGETIEWNATQKTSPSPFIIQKFLRRLVDEGHTHAVLEYSSHGLVQGRMNHTWPKVAAITNISEEHLDYHKTMDEYIRAKGLLFTMLPKNGVAVLNYDDRTFDPFSHLTFGIDHISYSSKAVEPEEKTGFPVDLWTEDIRSMATGSKASLTWNPRVNYGTVARPNTYELLLNIPGAFNIQNALCAIGCAKALGITMEDILTSLSSFKGIPGRMERIDEGQPFNVYVDFTVTPQSYEATLSTLKAALKPGQRLLVLTGSCGDRMKEKRPVVGKIVSHYADVMVVANEDPYTEDPEKIIDDVLAGADGSGAEIHRIFDRKAAIEFLLNEAKPGDTVILCGKGSDTTMWVGGGQIPWNEREITRGILRAKKAA